MKCKDCATKHISKALAYMAEYRLGYPLNKYKAIGELCLAADHLAGYELAGRIRATWLDIETLDDSLLQAVVDLDA